MSDEDKVIFRDFLGNTLALGDEVVYIERARFGNRGNRHLITGVITKLNKHKATVTHGKGVTYVFYENLIRAIREEE